MKTKILFIFFTYLFFGLFISCCLKSSIPYYDLLKFNIYNSAWEKDNEYLGELFQFEHQEWEFYSANSHFFNSAFAMQPCPSNGDSGAKFPIIEIEVSCNQPYKSVAPNTDIVKHLYSNYNYSDSLVSIENSRIFESLNQGELDWFHGEIYVPKLDSLDKKYVFTVKFTKSNGESIQAISDTIVW